MNVASTLSTLMSYLPALRSSIQSQLSTKLTKRLLTVTVLLLLVWLLMLPSVVSAYAGLGGYLSEKLLGESGGTDASLYLGDSADGPVVLGSIPVITTMSVTDAEFGADGATATLRGNILTNGMPEADYWFVWGYAPDALVYTTTSSTTATTGEKTTVLSGYDPGLTVYYQFRAGTDAEAQAGTLSFIANDGRGLAFWLMRNILTLAIAAGILVACILVARTGNWVAALVMVIAGMVAIAIIDSIITG